MPLTIAFRRSKEIFKGYGAKESVGNNTLRSRIGTGMSVLMIWENTLNKEVKY
ncbi:MAG: hypothetical protein AAGU27_10385 [Dehalobacterium sp.]